MKDKKKAVIGALCALVMIMAVGYALLGQNLSISGTSSITSNWQVEITNIIVKEKSTGATTNNTNYTATTASFNTSLTSPGDYALYEVTVTNKGTLDAVLSAEPTVTTGNNEAITYELEGIKKGDKILKNNQTDTFTIKVQYNQTDTQPNNLTSDIQVSLNYEQDLGQVSPYDYSIGDVISFNNANWIVIRNSTDDEDYVTLMKEKVLTHQELGSYAITYTCTSYDVRYSERGCTKIGEIKEFDTMQYYFGSTCHSDYQTGETTYNEWDESGCAGHNDYAGSKVKEFLEGPYINTLGESKLKEVDGYKIRLITTDEIIYNLGWTSGTETNVTTEGNNVPVWVYSGFGENQNNVYYYWTMTPSPSQSYRVYTVRLIYGKWQMYASNNLLEEIYGVRPVINLYKSAIE